MNSPETAGCADLMLRYLDGRLSRSEVDELNRRMKADRTLIHQFARFLLLEVRLVQLGREEKARESGAAFLFDSEPTAAFVASGRARLGPARRLPYPLGLMLGLGLPPLLSVPLRLLLLPPGADPSPGPSG